MAVSPLEPSRELSILAQRDSKKCLRIVLPPLLLLQLLRLQSLQHF
jgi:hypothetical protein